MKLRAYRLVREHRGGDAFTGEGARLYGGRWNPPGMPATYLSASRALAVLEILVHQPERMPSGRFLLFEAEFPESFVTAIPLAALGPKWRRFPAGPETTEPGERWLRDTTSPVLRVPSVLIPEESNYLFNPLHPRHAEIVVGAPRLFALDPRLERTASGGG